MGKQIVQVYSGVKEMLMRPERQLGTQYVSTYLLVTDAWRPLRTIDDVKMGR